MLGSVFFSSLRRLDFSLLHYLCREELDFNSVGRVTAVLAFFSYILDKWCSTNRDLSLDYMLDALAYPLWQRVKFEVRANLMQSPGQRRQQYQEQRSQMSHQPEAPPRHHHHLHLHWPRSLFPKFHRPRSGSTATVCSAPKPPHPFSLTRSASDGRLSSRVQVGPVSPQDLPMALNLWPSEAEAQYLPPRRSSPQGGPCLHRSQRANNYMSPPPPRPATPARPRKSVSSKGGSSHSAPGLPPSQLPLKPQHLPAPRPLSPSTGQLQLPPPQVLEEDDLSEVFL